MAVPGVVARPQPFGRINVLARSLEDGDLVLRRGFGVAQVEELQGGLDEPLLAGGLMNAEREEREREFVCVCVSE